MDRHSQYRVVVLGGGPAGCALALTLARRGVDRVLLSEATHGDKLAIGEKIPPGTRPLLESLGLWETFLSQQHEPCLDSDPTRNGYNDFGRQPARRGWCLDRRRFDRMLFDAVRQSGVTVRNGLRFSGIDAVQDSGYRLRLTDNKGRTRRVNAYFVVDATGRRASFARRAGAMRRKLDRLICVYGFFNVPDASLFTRLPPPEPVNEGWWYTARLPGRKLAVALAADPETVKRQRLDTVGVWRQHLAATRDLGARLDNCSLINNKLVTLPAHSHYLEPVAGRRWLAVGDAASALDPVATHGIHNALCDGSRAAEVVDCYLHGDTTELTQYRQQIAERVDEYLSNRRHVYSPEKRRPDTGLLKEHSAVA